VEMDAYKKLLLANQAWVTEKLAIRPDYFARTAETQQPAFMWLGCSDSRVPAEDVTGAEPGELFVHRNVANLVVPTDLNMLSVVQFAVEKLKVKHIIICGHYGCGGVKNAMGNKDLGLINQWLRQLKDVYRAHSRELETLEGEARTDRLVELNVQEQVQNLAETALIQRAWAEENRPWIHGWVYDLKTGLLKELSLLKPGRHPEDIDHFDFGPRTPA